MIRRECQGGCNITVSSEFGTKTALTSVDSRIRAIVIRAERTHMVNMADDPKLYIRKALHAPIWSVWEVTEHSPSEEIFEASSEEEATNWINTSGQTWLEERRRKRSE